MRHGPGHNTMYKIELIMKETYTGGKIRKNIFPLTPNLPHSLTNSTSFTVLVCVYVPTDYSFLQENWLRKEMISFKEVYKLLINGYFRRYTFHWR